MSVAPNQVLEEGFWDHLVQKLSFMFLIGVISCPGSTVLKSKGTQEPAWKTKHQLLSSPGSNVLPLNTNFGSNTFRQRQQETVNVATP